MFLGTSGSGKSTLIRTLTDEEIQTSNKSNSCTKDSKLYSCNLSKSIHLLDTVGTEDTDGMSTDEILKNICDKIGDKGQSVKIVWIVTPNIKDTPQLQAQARFINSLNKNIWNSVIVICKKGMEQSSSQGAIAAASKYTKTKLEAYNLHIYDIAEGWQSNMLYSMMSSKKLKERTEKPGCILLKFKEVKKWIFNKIKNIKLSKIEMKKIHYHSPGYTEYKKHSGKYCIDKWSITKKVGTGLAIGAGIGLTGGLVGVGGVALATSETLLVGETIGVVGTVTGFGSGCGGIGFGIEPVLSKCKESIYKWDCCNQNDEKAPGCKTYKRCLWCQKNSEYIKGCKESWVPKNYDDEPKRFLVKN